APLFELQPRALEGVRLDDLRAGLEHRAVYPLDHVGAAQHERLMALAGEAAVVLLRERELLQRRAHAAVVDDDALLDRLQVVAGHAGHASHRARSHAAAGRVTASAAVAAARQSGRLPAQPAAQPSALAPAL